MINDLKKNILAVLFFLTFVQSTFCQEIIALYPKGKIAYAKNGSDVPSLTVFRPENTLNTGTSVIVCSGGSYAGRANEVEGLPACKKLTNAGITAFLLDYRVPDGDKMEQKDVVPLTDAQCALLYVREHAAYYKLNPNKIGMMGFSAGGHLVSTVGTSFNQSKLLNPNKTNLRPDFLVLIYPVISFADSITHLESRFRLIGPDITPEKVRRFSNNLQVSDRTPPTFITSGLDDSGVNVKNSLYFAAALKQHQVPVELFLYAKGEHGYGVFNKDAKVQWIDDCIRWINNL